MKISLLPFLAGIIWSICIQCTPDDHKNENNAEAVLQEHDSSSVENSTITDNKKAVFNDTLSLTQYIQDLTTCAFDQNFDDLNNFIHPELGLHFIFRTGANLDIVHFTTLDNNWQVPGFGTNEFFESIQIENVKFESWPNYVDCGEDGFSKEGNFVAQSKNYDVLTSIHTHNTNEYGAPFLNSSELDLAQKAEDKVKYSLISTSNHVLLHFILIDEIWYLGIINKGAFDCSG